MQIINLDCYSIENYAGSSLDRIGLNNKTEISVFNSGYMNIYVCNTTVIEKYYHNSKIQKCPKNIGIKNYKSTILFSSLLFSLFL